MRHINSQRQTGNKNGDNKREKSSAADKNTTTIKKIDKVQHGDKDKLSKCKNLHLKKKTHKK